MKANLRIDYCGLWLLQLRPKYFHQFIMSINLSIPQLNIFNHCRYAHIIVSLEFKGYLHISDIVNTPFIAIELYLDLRVHASG